MNTQWDQKSREWQLLLCRDEPVGKSFWGTTRKPYIYHLSFENHLKRVNTGCTQTHTLSMQWVWQSTFRLYKYERDMYHMSKTLMRLTHVQWTSSYEWYRKHVGLECNNMMDRSNIEWAISRGGEHKAMSSLAHLSPYLPSLFTPSYKQQDGGIL